MTHTLDVTAFPDVRDPVWGTPTWPDWLKMSGFRPHQKTAILEVLDRFSEGCQVVMLNAPTGSGKTLTGEAVRRLMGLDKALYVATTKSLQHQAARDFPYAKILKGRSNYSTLDRPELLNDKFSPLSAADCQMQRKELPACDNCIDSTDTEVIHCALCFTGDTIVESPGTEVAYRRWYEGSVATIKTASGKELTGTPNHPILTSKGWVSLGSLVSGDYVVSSSRTEGGSRGDPNVEDQPSSFAEIFRALEVTAVSTDRIPGVHMDFHGDGFESQVDVVRTHSELRDRNQAGFTDPDERGDFLPGERLFPQSFLRAMAAACRLVTLDDPSGATDVVSELLDRFPSEVALDEIVDVDVRTWSGHVYNLQTEGHWYQANGIFASNCHPWFYCPYQVAKRKALDSKLLITNTAYYISEANGQASALKDYPLVIMDEADALENILVDFCQLEISERRRISLGIEPPALKTVESAWLPWVMNEAIPRVEEAINELPNPLEEVPDIREYTALSRLWDRLQQTKTMLEKGNTVYDGYKRGEVVFQPIFVHQDSKRLLWSHADKFLLMSATLIPEELEQTLGIEAAGLKWGVVNVPSTYPPENRPIHVHRSANMTFKSKDDEWPKMVKAIIRVLAKHPKDRTLIHTVSYAFTAYLYEQLHSAGVTRPIYTYRNASEREGSLKTYLGTEGAILLAPSMERGLDLRDDQCRVVIITKVPWLSTKDKRVEKRVYSPGGQFWYRAQAIRSLVQMTGRGVRSEDDWADSYILDAQFYDNLWKKSKHLFPPWWIESLDFSGGSI